MQMQKRRVKSFVALFLRQAAPGTIINVFGLAREDHLRFVTPPEYRASYFHLNKCRVEVWKVEEFVSRSVKFLGTKQFVELV